MFLQPSEDYSSDWFGGLIRKTESKKRQNKSKRRMSGFEMEWIGEKSARARGPWVRPSTPIGNLLKFGTKDKKVCVKVESNQRRNTVFTWSGCSLYAWWVLAIILGVLKGFKASSGMERWPSGYSDAEDLSSDFSTQVKKPHGVPTSWQAGERTAPGCTPTPVTHWTLSLHDPLCHPIPHTWTFSLWPGFTCNPSRLYRHKYKPYQLEKPMNDLPLCWTAPKFRP